MNTSLHRVAALALGSTLLLGSALTPALAQRSTPVTVINTDAQPVPVETGADRNARTPLAERVVAAFGSFRGIPTSDRVAGDEFAVPAGQILVIEHVTLRVTIANADQVGFMEVKTTTGGSSAVSHVLAVRTDLAALPVGSTQKIVSYNWPVTIYADPGSDVILNLNSTVGSPGGSAIFTVSGYLIPDSSATIGR